MTKLLLFLFGVVLKLGFYTHVHFLNFGLFTKHAQYSTQYNINLGIDDDKQ